MKRLTVSLVALLALLLVADRAGAALAARAVAAQAQAEAGLSSPPEVRIGGFPFLTQALAGRYDRVTVRATGVPAGEVRLARLDTTLTGVEVPLSAAVSGAVDAVPVGSVRARALVAYRELTRRSGDRRLTVTAEGGRLRVTGSVDVRGRTVSATALSRVDVVEGDLVVTAEEYRVGNETVDELLERALGERLDLRVPVEGLPYGLRVTGVEVQPDGVAVLARAGATTLVAAGERGSDRE